MANDSPVSGEEVKHRIELLATVLLGLATVAIALATYRAAIHDDGVTENFHNALVAEGQANDQFSLYDTTFAFEQGLFIEWLVATTDGNDDAAVLIEGVMGDGLRDISLAWLNDTTDEFATPFDDDTSRLESTEFLDAADEFGERAAAFEEAANVSDKKGDLLGLAQVLFAITLFTAGMAVILKTPAMQRAVLILGCTVVLIGSAIFIAGETMST